MFPSADNNHNLYWSMASIERIYLNERTTKYILRLNKRYSSQNHKMLILEVYFLSRAHKNLQVMQNNPKILIDKVTVSTYQYILSAYSSDNNPCTV